MNDDDDVDAGTDDLEMTTESSNYRSIFIDVGENKTFFSSDERNILSQHLPLSSDSQWREERRRRNIVLKSPFLLNNGCSALLRYSEGFIA